jgi:polar amino acid transport system substrate-binding protein
MRAANALAVVVLAAAPAATAGAAPQAVPTKQPGILAVGVSLPSTGFQAGAVRGRAVVAARGLEIDLARSLAGRLGIRRVHFQNERVFSRIHAAGAKKWDVALAQVEVTPARRQRVDFSIPYMDVSQGVLLRKYLSPVPRSISALRSLQVCAVRGSSGAAAVTGILRPQKAPILAFDLDALMESLRMGRCEAAVYHAPSLGAGRALQPTRYGALAGRLESSGQYAVVLERGSSLRPHINAALRQLIARGTLSALSRRWLSTDVARLPVLR